MFFTSYEFLGFVTVLLLLYYVIPQRFQWMLLLAFSGFFYYAANPVYLLYIGTTIVTVWFAACKMSEHPDKVPAHLELGREEKKAYKKDEVPVWFNQEIEKEEMSDEELAEMEELLSEFR